MRVKNNICIVLTVGFVCYMYFVVYALILPAVCKQWTYSKYFAIERNDPNIVRQLLKENNARLKSSQEFLRTVNASRRSVKFSRQRLDLVIAIITINRDTEDTGTLGFLTQTVAHALLLNQTDETTLFKHKHIIVCNVDKMGYGHSEATSLSKILDVVVRFPTSDAKKEHVGLDLFEKEKMDYVYCLRQAEAYDPRFVLVLEDDVVLRSSSLETISHLLNLRMTQMELGEKDLKSWLFVKLYYPEKWQGYGNEMDKIGELLGIAVLGGLLFNCNVTIFSKLFKNWKPSRLMKLLSFCLGAATSVMTVVLVGRPYVQSWRSFTSFTHRLIPSPDCCTQAILYPIEMVQSLAKHLPTIECDADFSVDLAIDTFARTRHLKRLLVEPNLCRHIGFVSTVRGYAKSAAEFLD